MKRKHSGQLRPLIAQAQEDAVAVMRAVRAEIEGCRSMLIILIVLSGAKETRTAVHFNVSNKKCTQSPREKGASGVIAEKAESAEALDSVSGSPKGAAVAVDWEA